MSASPLPFDDAGFPNARILLVDDDPLIARTLGNLLGLHGWVPTHADSGEAALALLETGAYDVVLLDVRLPGIDGFETCKAIRARLGASLPVVLMTAMGDRVAQRRGYDSGADEFLTKPIDALTLVLKLRVFLRLKSLHDEAHRHREEAQARARDLGQLHELGRDWSLVARPEDFYRLVTQRLAALIQARVCLIALWDAGTRQMASALPAHGVADDVAERLRYTVKPEHRTMFNFRSGRPYVSNHARTDPRLIVEMVNLVGAESLVLVPMMSEGRFLGLLIAGDRPGGFTDSELQLLALFAGPAATFLRSRLIFEQQVRHASRLQAFAELSGALAGNYDRAALLDLALGRLTGPLGYAAAAFHRVDGESVRQEAGSGGVAVLDPELPRWAVRSSGPLPSGTAGSVEIAAPVRAADRALGVLVVRRASGAFEDQETSLVASFAGQLAVALLRAEVAARTTRLARQMATLYELGLETAALRDLRQLFTRAADEAGRLIDADHTSVFRLRPDLGALEPFAMWTRDVQAETYSSVTFRVGEGVAGRVARDRMPALVNEPSADPNFVDRGNPVARLACIPVTYFDQARGELAVFGVLNATRRPGRPPFTADDLDYLTRFASQLSIAAANSMAFAAERARSEQLVLVNTLLREIAGSLSRDRVLDTAVRRIHEAFGYSTVHVVVPDRDAGVNRVLFPRGHRPAPSGWVTYPLQCGVTWRVISSRQTAVLADVSRDPDYVAMLPSTRSEVMVPILVGGEVAAILHVQSDVLDAFSPSEVLTLETLADGIGIGLRNAELYETVERSNAQLVELDRMKTELVNIVAHDFRAPLSGVVGNAELLGGEPDAPREERLQLAHAILESAEHLASMVHNTLETTRLDSGQFGFEFGVVDLVAVVRSVVRRQPKAIQQRIELGLPEDPIASWADSGRVAEVLENLLGNAVRYSPDGGPIRVEVRPEGELARVRVEDEGIGIEPRHLGRLFKPFSRVREGRAAEIEGSGLGLYICDRIVRAHGGTLHVESAPGRGSTFSFTIPVYGLTAQTGGRVLLVAAFDEASRREVRKAARELGFSVQEARDGVEAVEIASRTVPAAIIVERVFPRLGAVEVARRIRDGRGTSGVAVVVLAEAEELGADADLFRSCVGRPAQHDRILSTLRALG
jgi:signal transduction histidine kinase/DNA-binding response OmpR family regulator